MGEEHAKAVEQLIVREKAGRKKELGLTALLTAIPIAIGLVVLSYSARRLAAAHKEVADCLSQVGELEKRKQTLEGEARTLRGQVADLTHGKTQVEDDLQKRKKEVNAARDREAELKAKVERQRKEIVENKAALAEQRDRLVELDAQEQQAREKVDRLTKEKQAQAKQLTELTQKKDSLQAEIEKTKEYLAKLKKEKDDLDVLAKAAVNGYEGLHELYRRQMKGRSRRLWRRVRARADWRALDLVDDEGRSCFEFRLWVEGPDKILDTIEEAEYFFDHESFGDESVEKSRERSGPNPFMVSYTGWGSITNVIVTLRLQDGYREGKPFNMDEGLVQRESSNPD